MVKIIRLADGHEVLVDEDLYEALNAIRWYVSTSGYVINRNSICGVKKTIRMHHLVLELRGVEIPDGCEPDHKNRNRLDNQFENLRASTRSRNLANRSAYKNKHGYRGVEKREDGRYRGKVWNNGKRIQTPTFDTPEEAAKARDELAKQVYGEFAILNFAS